MKVFPSLNLTPPYCSILEIEPKELLKNCQCTYFQSSGAGGQKRNKVKSSVRLQLSLVTETSTDPLSVSATATESRSPEQNLSSALQKLRLSLAISLVFEGKKDFISHDWDVKQILKSPWMLPNTWPPFRYPVNASHKELPQIAYCVLWTFMIHKGKVRDASEQLNTSSSALVKFMYSHKTIWEAALRCRKEFELTPLKKP